MVTCALSQLPSLHRRSIGHSLRVDDTILAGDSSWMLGLMLAVWVLGYSVIVNQGIKLLGLLLTGSTGQRMATRNGLA